MQNATRYHVSAIVNFRGESRATLIGTAPSRRKARRIGYRKGVKLVPSRFSAANFELQIVDTATGKTIRSEWAAEEAYHRYNNLPTVAETGIW